MTIQRDSSLSQSSHSLTPPTPDHLNSPQRDDNEVLALQHELEALRAAHQQELERLRAETFAQFAILYAALDEARVALASAQTPGAISDEVHTHSETRGVTEAPTPDAQQEPGATADNHGASRRTLLKWGGLGAAATLAAAGGAAFTMPTAHANDGASVVLGQSNTAEHTTTLTYNGSEASPVVFQATTSAADSTGVSASAGGGTSAYGVYGTAGTNGNGVLGLANGTSSYGVYGTTDSGYAVVGISNTGIDMAALGAGRLWQKPASFTGAPTSGTYNTGEQIRDSAGNLYICITGGTPGIWKQVMTLGSGFNGGMIGFLSTPIRVYDSRPSNNPLVGNAARNVTVTGVNIGGVQVPKGSVGCIGNLTVYHPTTGGYLVIYPAGSPTPSSSTVNYVGGQTIPNSFAVGLSTGGQVTIHAFQSGSCHFIVDITGFVS